MNGLTKAGVSVTGYAPALGKYQGPYKNNIKIKYTWTLNLPMIRVMVYDLILFFRLLLTFPKPDVMYVRVAYFTLFTPLIAKLFGVPLVLEINGNVVHDVISKGWTGIRRFVPIWCEGFLHRIAQRSICVSETIVAAVHEYYGIPLNKLIALQNGVNVEHFKPLDQQACKTELKLAQDVDYIGYVGCFTGWDGIEHIVRAYTEIARVFPKIKILLVGDGDHRPFVESEVKRLGLEKQVIFTGYVPYKDLPKYINCFSVAVAPYGGSPEIEARNKKGGLSSLKSLEYNAAGLPVVVADIASVEYVQQYNTGFIIPQGDERALVEKVLYLLGNRSVSRELGENGRRYVVQYRSWQSVANQTSALFDSLTKG
jgi:glycosyltransferase involved in cell wall biosynthesis